MSEEGRPTKIFVSTVVLLGLAFLAKEFGVPAIILLSIGAQLLFTRFALIIVNLFVLAKDYPITALTGFVSLLTGLTFVLVRRAKLLERKKKESEAAVSKKVRDEQLVAFKTPDHSFSLSNRSADLAVSVNYRSSNQNISDRAMISR